MANRRDISLTEEADKIRKKVFGESRQRGGGFSSWVSEQLLKLKLENLEKKEVEEKIKKREQELKIIQEDLASLKETVIYIDKREKEKEETRAKKMALSGTSEINYLVEAKADIEENNHSLLFHKNTFKKRFDKPFEYSDGEFIELINKAEEEQKEFLKSEDLI